MITRNELNERLYIALEKCVASLDQLTPHLAHIPADIGLLNDALITARPLLDALHAAQALEQK